MMDDAQAAEWFGMVGKGMALDTAHDTAETVAERVAARQAVEEHAASMSAFLRKVWNV
ncbi:hypothetical protein [Cellulosimicrobium sp. TH-20]|uniref:hypothetical protein n=1 Tax=Cellulosimicrobium sp. TH-20 TaxID=1980001 RepID=UPI0016431E5E|nr:hypothetical protein [Cellulosimicrobium sp. TH-20]